MKILYIDQKFCVKCSLCKKYCPFKIIVGDIGFKHKINIFGCNGCGLCFKYCPTESIKINFYNIIFRYNKKIIKYKLNIGKKLTNFLYD